MSIAISKEQAILLIQRFTESDLADESWYQDIREYLSAIILYGSIAKGKNRLDSDIDILLIMPLDIEEKYTRGEYTYEFKGYEINIVIRSVEGLKKIVKEGNNLFQKEVFRDSEIIWSKDEEIVKLIKLINFK